MIPSFAKGIPLCFLNIRGLLNKFDDLKYVLTKTLPQIGIIGLNETFCNDSISDEAISLKDFQIFRKDRNNHGGGVLVYVSNALSVSRKCDLECEELEMVCLEVRPKFISPFIYICLYRPPSATKDFFSKLDDTLGKMPDNVEVVLMGDLNCNFVKEKSSSETRSLQALNEIYQFVQLIDIPTRITNNTSSIIDVLECTKPEIFTEHGVITLSISDHYMIFGILSGKKLSKNLKSITYRSYKKFNENHFKCDLSSIDWNFLYESDDINVLWVQWKHTLLKIIDDHLPSKSRRIKEKHTPWITSDIRDLMIQRDKKLKQFLKSSSEIDWNNYKHLRNKVNCIVKSSKKKYFHKRIFDCKNNVSETWKCIKEILPAKEKSSLNKITVKGNEYEDPLKIANHFNDHFISVTKDLINPNTCTHIQQSLVQAETCNISKEKFVFDLPKVNNESVTNAIKSLNTNASCGLDGISCKIIKLCGNELVPSLVFLINKSFSSGCFPRDWKEAKVFPLHKKGNIEEMNNFRPISVLSIISKIIEKIVNTEMDSFFVNSGLLCKKQFGFRKNHSTETALVYMVNDWYASMNNGKMVGVIFVDLKKAFDLVDLDLLLCKLENCGFSESAVAWFKDYLCNRSQRVNVNGVLSKSRIISKGVPQGSILGPKLFSIFINDMPNVLQYSKIVMYADDTSIYTEGDNLSDIRNKLQIDINNIIHWLEINRMVMNYEKTKCMVIGTHGRLSRVMQSNESSLNIICNNHTIEEVRSFECLGVIIDNELLWKDHVSKVSKKVSQKIGILRRLKAYVNENTLLTLYNSMVLPILDYCCIVWGNRFKEDTERLNKLQKRAARIILNADFLTPSDTLFASLELKRFEKRVEYFRYLLMFKCMNGLAPMCLSEMFTFRKEMHSYGTRSSSQNKLHYPKCHMESFRHSFHYIAVSLWNNLDPTCQNITSLSVFRNYLQNNV